MTNTRMKTSESSDDDFHHRWPLPGDPEPIESQSDPWAGVPEPDTPESETTEWQIEDDWTQPLPPVTVTAQDYGLGTELYQDDFEGEWVDPDDESEQDEWEYENDDPDDEWLDPDEFLEDIDEDGDEYPLPPVSTARPTWSLRPTRWHLVRLQLGLIAIALLSNQPWRPPSAIGWIVVATLILVAIPLPAKWLLLMLTEDVGTGVVQLRSKRGWLNPVDHLLSELKIDNAPGRTGEPVAVAQDGHDLVSAIRVSSPDDALSLADGYESIVELLQWGCEWWSDEATVQLMVTVRDIPTRGIATPSAQWSDQRGQRLSPVGGQDSFSILRSWIVIRVRTGVDSNHTLNGPLAGTPRGRMRRVLLAITEDIESAGLIAEPLDPSTFRRSLEISSAGPEINLGASEAVSGPDGPIDTGSPRFWRFGDRIHISYEIRRCRSTRFCDILAALESSPTVAAVTSFTVGQSPKDQEVPPRHRHLACTIRLTVVDHEAIDAARHHIEGYLDDLGIKWHRLDKMHREGFLCSLPLARRLPGRPIRLSWSTLTGRHVRSWLRSWNGAFYHEVE